MDLSILPVRTAGAAEHMAVDFLLLQRWPGPVVPRFRHYEWRGPAFTFGYSQKIAFIRGELPVAEGVRFDLCRRPTGGGLVDHRADWTYALVIPRGHPLEEVRATESYRRVHAAIAEALQAQGVKAKLATEVAAARDHPVLPVKLLRRGPNADGPSAAGGHAPPRSDEALVRTNKAAVGSNEALVCFERAEVHDVVGAGGAKIAGAAQKRTKHGLLFQGSISRPAAGAAVDWERFEADFTSRLARELGGTAQPAGWPEFQEDEVDGLAEQYAAPEWTEAR